MSASMIVRCHCHASRKFAGTSKGMDCGPSASVSSSKARRVCSSVSSQFGVFVKANVGGSGGSCECHLEQPGPGHRARVRVALVVADQRLGDDGEVFDAAREEPD